MTLLGRERKPVGEAINAKDDDADTNEKRPGKKEQMVYELLAAIAKATLHIDTLKMRGNTRSTQLEGPGAHLKRVR